MGKNFEKWRFRYTCVLFLVLAFLIGNSMSKKVQAKGDAYDELRAFSEVLSLIQKSYVDEVESKDLVQGAIVGMLKTLDPHSSYMPPEVYKEVQVETEGSFGGLGIEITIKDGQLTVVSPIEDTPAFQAGIKAGDQILKVNGEPTRDITLLEAVNKMRGPIGTKVTITIMRDEFAEPKDFEINRAIIKIKSVKWKMLEDNIGYIRLSSFHKTTADEAEDALKELVKNQMAGLILDLRNNPGGLLDQAVKVTDLFLKEGELIVYTKGRVETQNLRFVSHGKGSYLGFPMVVLVNAGSASASEIVSGALQDLGRSVILGSKTFGKGSVQTIIPLSDGSGLRLTTSKYYTPKGRSIQEKGILPDIVVETPQTDQHAKLLEGEKRLPVIREKDLKRHLKGEDVPAAAPEEKEEPKNPEEEKQVKDKGVAEEDLALQRAHDLLKSLTIFKKILVTNKAN